MSSPSPYPAADPASSGEPWVPFWLVRLGALGWRLLVVLAFALVLAGILWAIGTVTASVALALLISAAFAPLVIRLRARGYARTKAAAVATLAAVGIGLLVLGMAAFVLVQSGPDLIRAVASGMEALRGLLEDAALPPEVADTIARLTDQVRAWLASGIGGLAGAIASLFTILLFGTFTTFFLLQDGDEAWEWAMHAASERRRAAATASGLRGLSQVGGYLRTVALLAAVAAAVDYVLLLIFGVPNALPLAMLVFVGGFIPYLGSLVATSAVLLVALVSIGPQATLILLGLIVVARILGDRIVGRYRRTNAVHVHPAIILVALPIGAYVAGLFGLLMAVPIAAFILATGGSLLDAIRPDPEEDAEADGPSVVPDWLDVLAQWSWRLLVGIAVIGIAVIAVIQVPIVLLPIIIAAVLASTFAPLMRVLLRRGWGTTVSAGAVTVGAYVGITLIVVITIAALVSNVDKVTGDASSGAGSIDAWLEGLAGTVIALIDALGSGIAGTVATLLANLVVLTLATIFGAILTFFFLRDGGAAWAAVTRGLAPWRRREADGAAGRAVGVLGDYMVGTGAISAFGALTQLVIMVVLGIPLALPLAVLSFFGGFIPYIGSIVTTGLAFLVTVATGDTTDIAVMAIFTIVFNIVQGNIVAPLVYGRAVNIHPAIVLLAIPAGSAVAGVLGMFLVVPFLGVVATTWRTVLVVMGERHPEPEPVESTAPDAPAEPDGLVPATISVPTSDPRAVEGAADA